MTIPSYPDAKVALKGKKGLIVGIANDQSIAWGCAKAFRALGADLAVTYLNDRARKHVEPLAKALEAPIFMPLDVNTEGQLGQVFEKIQKEWGQCSPIAGGGRATQKQMSLARVHHAACLLRQGYTDSIAP